MVCIVHLGVFFARHVRFVECVFIISSRAHGTHYYIIATRVVRNLVSVKREICLAKAVGT